MSLIEKSLREKWYKKFCNRITKWIDLQESKNYRLIAEESLMEQIELYERSNDPAKRIYSGPLGQLYTYWLASFSASIIYMDSDFLEKLVKGYTYLKLQVRQSISKYKIQGANNPPGLSANDLFDCICISIILDDNEGFTSVHSYCNELFENGLFAEYSSLDVPYGRYALALGNIYKGANPADTKSIHPSYDGIFQNWNNPQEQLASSILDALDYHLLSEGDYRVHQKEHDKMYPEFIYAQGFLAVTVLIFPLEIIALYKLRDRMQLTTLEVEHPLMGHDLLERMRAPINWEYSDKLIEKFNKCIS